ncbi:MAG: hypothetical protein KatS3mg091_251 [Patescibacteria group bacterium]|nr:MAG: hypothetical protein KatS3mg091_251 [Patescibacteria group bacterium]
MDFSNAFLAGILGGLIRGVVGIVKYFEKNQKNSKINWWYLFFSLFTAGLVGGFAGVFANHSWEFAFLAGYAGTDFLEGLYKIRLQQKFEI